MKLLLLLGLGLTLVCVHAEEVSSLDENFNVEKIDGDWFSIVLASDKREKIEENGSMRVFVDYTHVLGTSLAFKFHTIVNDQCTPIFLVADETEKKGKYSVMYDGYNTFTVLKTDYTSYVIFHLINEKDGETFQLMELFGREPDLSSDIKEKFVDLCEKHGIVRENVIDLTKTNRCLEARD